MYHTLVADQKFPVRLVQSLCVKNICLWRNRTYAIIIYKIIFISHKMNFSYVTLANMTDGTKPWKMFICTEDLDYEREIFMGYTFNLKTLTIKYTWLEEENYL